VKRVVANKLQEKAEVFCENFSRTDREYNHNNETFSLKKITPLSESTAVAIAEKDTGKVALAFFYCLKVNSQEPDWRYFIPTESHIYGMKKLTAILHRVEQINFPQNFESEMDRVNEAVEEMFKDTQKKGG